RWLAAEIKPMAEASSLLIRWKNSLNSRRSATVQRSGEPTMSTSPACRAPRDLLSASMLHLAMTALWACRVSRVAPLFPVQGTASVRSRRLVQEPYSAFRLVDPVLQHACGSDVAILIAQLVNAPHFRGQLLIVAAEFREHVLRVHKIRIIVENAL